MPYLKTQKPELIERVIAALCYLSFGMVGLIYILLSGRYSNSYFFRFHFLQSIILGIFAYLLSWAGVAVSGILTGILSLILSPFGSAFALLMPIEAGIGGLLGLIRIAALGLLMYGCIFAAIGKFAQLPILSKIVYGQLH